MCSGKAPRTFDELLCKARSPLMVAAAANVAGTACVGAIAVSALPLATAFLCERLPPVLLLVDVVFVCAVYAAHRCGTLVDFVCAVGVVVELLYKMVYHKVNKTKEYKMALLNKRAKLKTSRHAGKLILEAKRRSRAKAEFKMAPT